MRQHIVGGMTGRGTRRPRLVIEDANPVLQVSDLTCYREAGFDVTVCSGPDDAADCPLVEGGTCEVVATADVILFGPDREVGRGRAVVDAVVARHPGVPLVTTGSVSTVDDALFLRFPASVDAQVDAARRALRAGRPRRPDQG